MHRMKFSTLRLAVPFSLVPLSTAAVVTFATAASHAADHASDNAPDNAAGHAAQANQSETVPAGLIQLPAHSRYYAPYAFVVDKQARTLAVWQQTGSGLRKVADFPADLGKNSGDKKSVGDAKTPEGIYFLLDRLDGEKIDFSRYGKRAFVTDYPNFFDRREGKTGNGIWLHAVPDHVPLTRGSKGCVVVRNDAILNLTQYVTLGRTPLLIQNQTEQLPLGEMGKISGSLQSWLESWRAAWESKNIDTYISFYDSEFYATEQKMNRSQWRAFKKNLSDRVQKITVHLSKPAIFADRDRAVVRFLQEYTSDQHADFGEKVLYLRRRKDSYRIVGENWNEETSKTARDEIEATTVSATAQVTPPTRSAANATTATN